MSGRWACLFSGGKDSYLAYRAAQEAGHAVEEIVTVDAPHGSYLYHAPATALTPMIAEALGCTYVSLELAASETPEAADSGAASRQEREPLDRWLAEATSRSEAPITGLVAGVVDSEYQYELLHDLGDTYDIDVFTPLWHRTGADILTAVERNDIAVDVVAVAAEGLDANWLGRRLDSAAVEELLALASEYGLHPAGEGGEFETAVVNAPRFANPIRYEASPVWEGTRGHLEIETVEPAITDR